MSHAAVRRAVPDEQISHVLSYPARGSSCALMRRDTAEFLRDVNLDERMVDDAVELAVLVVSELATNGLAHHRVGAREQLDLMVFVRPGVYGTWVVVSVTDGGRGRIGTGVNAGDDASERGRGLMLLRCLGVRLSGQAQRDGYRVTASFPVDAGARTRVCRCDCDDRGHEVYGVCRTVVPAAAKGRTVEAIPELGEWTVCLPCLSAPMPKAVVDRVAVPWAGSLVGRRVS
jgi:hypothetical protein